MRTDTSTFSIGNSAKAKRPRYTIELAFDAANTVLRYFTSHSDAQVPVGGTVIGTVIESISGTSQTLNPDKATASIGNITFKAVDLASAITSQLGSQLVLGRSTRRQRVRVYVGYEGFAWADYALVQTQLVTDIAYDEGTYTFRCMDIQREMRKEIFEKAKTTLSASLDAVGTTVNVYDTSAFSMVAHGTSYSDAPSTTVGYIKIQDEVIRYTGLTSTSFTGCTRGALNTRAVEHAIDPNATADRRTAVEEYIFLEMPAPKLAYALLTGDIPGFALKLSSASSQMVTIAHTASMDVITADWTVEAWYKPTSFPSGEPCIVSRVYPAASGTVPFKLEVDASAAVRAGFFSAGWYEATTAAAALQAGTSYHLVGIKRGTTLEVWINGSLIASTPGVPAATPVNNTSDIRIGRRWDSAEYLDGLVDGVRIYSRALSVTEVAQHAQSIFSNETGLIGKWNFDEGTGTTAADTSGNGNNGTLVNGPTWAPLLAMGGGYRLPTKWNLGIAASYVQPSDFTSKADLWDTLDDRNGFVVRFEDLDKGDGKKFIESELALLCGAYMPVYATGALGFKRMANILAGASYVKELNHDNASNIGQLLHDFDSLHNLLQVSWNWEPLSSAFTRVNLLVDQNSITVHGKSDPLKLEFRGLHGSRHSSVMLATRFDALRDRYSGPPLRLSLDLVPSMNAIEIGDVVRVRLPNTRDIVSNGSLDRSFEVQGVKIDWISGAVKVDLFASSQAPGALAPTTDATVLPSSWYTATGTDLSTVLTITGSNPGHVSANGAITGGSDMNAAPSIFYYNGDLQIDSGKTVTITGNVQIRVKGFLQNNGTINGKGGGFAGAASAGTGSPTATNLGTQGFIGSTEAGGGIYYHRPKDINNFVGSLINSWIDSYRAPVVSGRESVVPSFNLSWDGVKLSGIPSEMRGSSGSSGLPMIYDDPDYNPFGFASVAGGAGGASGAGLAIVCRGFAQGASAKVDLSGADGTAGGFDDTNWFLGGTHRNFSGSGAGGAPGGLAIVLDGNGVSATGLSEVGFVALNGKTPVQPGVLTFASGLYRPTTADFNSSISSYFTGTGDGSTFPLPSLSGARGGLRVQYVPNNAAAAAIDPLASTLNAPTNLSLSSGTTELFVQGDGTIVPRIKVSWTPSSDARTLLYEVQFKPSSTVTWLNVAPIIGQLADTAWIGGVRDGVAYDVRIHAAGAVRTVSDWVTITNYTVIGKTALPTNVGALNFVDPFLSWPVLTDFDLNGYIVRYQPGSGTDWPSAIPAHKAGFITEARFDTGDIVGGPVTFLVKSIDTSGNESATAASLSVDLRPVTPTSFLVSRQPDGTREFNWSTLIAPDDLDGVRIRYFLGTTADWAAMTPLHNGILKASPFESNQLAAGTYTMAAKNVDRAGNESAAAIFITAVTIGDPRIAGAVDDFKEEPIWIGDKFDCHIN